MPTSPSHPPHTKQGVRSNAKRLADVLEAKPPFLLPFIDEGQFKDNKGQTVEGCASLAQGLGVLGAGGAY